MSTLAITAAHFAGLPARYAVGRWSNIPTNTLLVFNAADLGLYILVRRIWISALEKYGLDIPAILDHATALAIRVVCCLGALYVTSRLTEPMPLKAAALTNLAAVASIAAGL